MSMQRLIVGISGASGAVYGVRVLEMLRERTDIETHVVVTPAARRTIVEETGRTVESVHALADVIYEPADIGAAIASGAFSTMGMLVAPCSMKSLSGIANSYSDNLLLRAADVTLKERRRLVLLTRETPLHLGHLRLMVQITEMGGIVAPPVPAFYRQPQSIKEVVHHTLVRNLNLFGIG